MPEQQKNNDIEMIPEDAEISTKDPAAKIQQLREALTRSLAERKEYLEGWQRAKADLINYKKDEVKRYEEIMKFAAEGVIAEVVQVLDSFDLALEHAMPPDIERGIVIIRSQLEDILRRRGVEVIQAKGKKFDPAFHEAVGEVESDDPGEIVIEELQKGYVLNGKVVRPARVKISRPRREES